MFTPPLHKHSPKTHVYPGMEEKHQENIHWNFPMSSDFYMPEYKFCIFQKKPKQKKQKKLCSIARLPVIGKPGRILELQMIYLNGCDPDFNIKRENRRRFQCGSFPHCFAAVQVIYHFYYYPKTNFILRGERNPDVSHKLCHSGAFSLCVRWQTLAEQRLSQRTYCRRKHKMCTRQRCD